MDVRSGTSGWSYDHWAGVLYRPGLPAAKRLDRYAEVFDTVELNRQLLPVAGDHAEAVLVTYDPAKVRYDQLLRVFFAVTDPTQLNRQGPDEGSQYRSALVPLNDAQKQAAAAYLAQLGTSGLWRKHIVTRVENFRHFYPAEAYHQDFMAKNPGHPYTSYWDVPKVAAIQRLFPALYKADFTRN